MTVDEIKMEVKKIMLVRKTDPKECDELLNNLQQRIERHIDHHKLPKIWAVHLMEIFFKAIDEN